MKTTADEKLLELIGTAPESLDDVALDHLAVVCSGATLARLKKLREKFLSEVPEVKNK